MYRLKSGNRTRDFEDGGFRNITYGGHVLSIPLARAIQWFSISQLEKRKKFNLKKGSRDPFPHRNFPLRRQGSDFARRCV